MNIKYKVMNNNDLSDNIYKIIADNTFDWEYLLSINGESIYHSPSCKRITGYEPQEFYDESKKLFEIIHLDEKTKFIEHFNKEIQNTHSEIIEFRIIDSSGNIKWIEHACSSLFDVNGNCIGVRGSNREITSKKKIESIAQHLEVRYRNIIEHSPFGIGITKGNEIIYANEPLLRIHGVNSLEELKSKTLIERIHPVDRKKVIQQVKKVEEGKAKFPFSIEHKIIRNDGQVRLLHLRVSHYHEEGQHYLQSFITDVTEQEKISKASKKIMSEYLHVRKRKELISKIKSLLSDYYNKYSFDAADKVKILKVLDEYDDSESNWKNIRLHFDNIHEKYLEKLKKRYPKLTQVDLRLCAYIKLNLTTKEIAILTNVKATSIQLSLFKIQSELILDEN